MLREPRFSAFRLHSLLVLFEDEQALDTVLLNALDLGLEPTLQYLFQVAPSFPEFENWIQTITGGLPNVNMMAAFKAQVLGTALLQPNSQVSELTLSAADLQHWETYGYVVIKNAISRQDCE